MEPVEILERLAFETRAWIGVHILVRAMLHLTDARYSIPLPGYKSSAALFYERAAA